MAGRGVVHSAVGRGWLRSPHTHATRADADRDCHGNVHRYLNRHAVAHRHPHSFSYYNTQPHDHTDCDSAADADVWRCAAAVCQRACAATGRALRAGGSPGLSRLSAAGPAGPPDPGLWTRRPASRPARRRGLGPAQPPQPGRPGLQHRPRTGHLCPAAGLGPRQRGDHHRAPFCRRRPDTLLLRPPGPALGGPARRRLCPARSGDRQNRPAPHASPPAFRDAQPPAQRTRPRLLAQSRHGRLDQSVPVHLG